MLKVCIPNLSEQDLGDLSTIVKGVRLKAKYVNQFEGKPAEVSGICLGAGGEVTVAYEVEGKGTRVADYTVKEYFNL